MTKCPKCLNERFESAVACPECGYSVEADVTKTLVQFGINEDRAQDFVSNKPMTPERWIKIKDIFVSAQDLPIADRDEFIEEACAQDASIKEEVEKLLRSFSKEDGFLEESAVAEVASIIDEESGKRSDDEKRFAVGELLDNRYKIEKMLGKGGMGEVYLANDTKLNRKVALKVLPAELTDSKVRLQRFEQEARAVSALNHPHILTIFEFGESADGTHFIASEYVEGKTLNEYISSDELGLSRILDIAMQAASALSAAHEAGITHRDIKPDNIMVRSDGYIKVLDFGLAKLTEQAPVHGPDSEATTRALVDTNPGSVLGTAAYMSPEQARGVAIDSRTDLWSLGVVIYEMITRQRPFRGETSTDTIISVIKKDPPPLISYVPKIPTEIEWIVSKTLSKDLDGRYQTAKELHADLTKIKKRVEYQDELDRSTAPDSFAGDEEKHSNTQFLERVHTEEKDANTNELTGKIVESNDSQLVSQFDLAVAKTLRSRALTAFFAVLIFGIVSSGIYFAYQYAFGSNEIDSIAVLPFESGDGSKDLVYLTDGISESLIDRLSQLPQLRVIARNSSFKFRGKNLDIQDIAAKLGVRAIVMGQVIEAGEDLIIRVEIIDAVANEQIWGERFTRKSGDVLSMQREIAQTVSEKLRLKLTPDQEKRLASGGTEIPEAYRQYLNGMVELHGPDDVRGKAIEYFEKAVEIDPNFALAHAEIAKIHIMRANGTGDPRELMPKAKAAVERALEIDDNLAQAHAVSALIKENEFDWAGAGAEFKRAIELNPNLDFSRSYYAFHLSIMDRHDEALEQVKQALLRDPINERISLIIKGNILTQARRFDEAIRAFEDAEALDDGKNSMKFNFGYAYLGKKMLKEAAENFTASVEILGGPDKYSQPLVYLAATYAQMPGKRPEALKILNQLETSDEYVSPAVLAVVYSALGENDKAIRELEKSYEEKDVLLRYIGVGYEYDGLRNDPRFKALIKKTGLKSD